MQNTIFWKTYLPIGTETALLYSLHRKDVVMQLASVGPVSDL